MTPSSLLTSVVLSLTLATLPTLSATAASAPQSRHVVTATASDVDPASLLPPGTPVLRTFSRLGAIVVDLDAQQASALSSEGRLNVTRADAQFTATGPPPTGSIALPTQVTPAGVRRIGGAAWVASTGRHSEPVDADVAVMDSGISPHRDLTVAGGVDCTGGGSTADAFGHGTHMAGTIGARDNSVGVVGVAPGARLWAVKVMDADGRGSLESLLCGANWVAEHATTIEVVNLSISGPGTASCSDGSLGQALCRVLDAGVTVVAAAGNRSQDARLVQPASLERALTVSGLYDTDGVPGGSGDPTCSDGTPEDTFLPMSNYGKRVDLLAPGACVLSTVPGGAYGLSGGTSSAAAHVSGAVALVRANNVARTPDAVASVLRAHATVDWVTATDPDPWHEPVVNVAGTRP